MNLATITPKYSERLSLLKTVLLANGQPTHHFTETLKAIYQKNVTKYSQLTYLPQRSRDRLMEELGGRDEIIGTLKPALMSPSTQCVKALFELKDGQAIESVWMNFRDSEHTSLCVSSQVGCALKCSFCSTGAVGFKRQLTTDEILDQILYFKQQQPKGVDTISFMGMGEALQNPRVFDALDILTRKDIFNISPRRLSVSTVGIIPGIERLTRDFPNVNIAFSLHSPFDEQRTDLVPANRMFPLSECLKSLEQHALKTNRKIMFAYLVLPDYNDTREHAVELGNILKSFDSKIRHLFHVNLLRYNPAEGVEKDFRRTDRAHLDGFSKLLREQGVTNQTIRQSFGLDIDAACGQLYQVSKKGLDRPPTKFIKKTAASPASATAGGWI